jgi:hypothetical protein
MEAKRTWLISSGAVAFIVAISLFFALIVTLLYTPPIVRPPAPAESVAVDLIVESFEANAPTRSDRAPSPVRADAGVRELFGEVNATYTPDKPGTEPVYAPAPMARIEIEGDIGHSSRLPPEALQLEQTRAPSSRSSTREAGASSAGESLQNRYLAEIHQRLSAAWHPGHGDLGKMAMIEMRISAQGVVRYKIVQIRGDEPYRRRLQAALDRIERLEPPPRSLVLNVNFIVKE